ncbi:hypothetical protein H2198_002559 [Neophaeococcomyces mojaviensis]|uniref:Uncharacterized protein n=1 Tax=Neophaeococcomyces mojaviensis TaxID=3383035 RepID=A0ACC3ADZ6_9EURO|nr:hypothetical protein H2198_002559 [Knufia sp. JES_112]
MVVQKIDRVVPGIQGLLQGESWPKGTSTPFKPLVSQLKLSSLQESGLRQLCDAASNKLPSLPFSPATTYCAMQSPREQQHWADTDRPQSLCGMTVEPSTALQAFESLHMPKCAPVRHGGWLDTRNWLFNRLWKEVCDKSLDELHELFFTREARPEYGENHAVTRRSKALDNNEAETLPKASKDISKENHGKQERDRRERHRFFQKESDNRTPTSTFELSRQVLPEVKEEVKRLLVNEASDGSTEAVSSRKNRATPSIDKVAGKDDQLLAAVLTQDLASIVICREFDARITVERRLSAAEAAWQKEQARRIGAEERAHQLEIDCKHFSDEIAYFRRRYVSDEQDRGGSSTSFAQPQLPPPSTTQKRKRTTDSVDISRDSTVYSPSSQRQSKRQHFGADRVHQSKHSHSHTLLPPSPTPSCDGCSPSFCSG